MAIHIIADDRERAGEVIPALRACPDVELRVQRLPCGDFCIENRLLFERKALPDLMQSIVNGRLFRQALRLAATDYAPGLILEGTSADPACSRLSREAIQGALISVSIVLGIPVLRSLSSQETAWLLLCAAKQMERIAEGAVQRHGYRPKGRRKRQIYILQGLPGIGSDRAELLLDIFGSVEKVFTASYEDLMQVKGIGKATARRIREILEEA